MNSATKKAIAWLAILAFTTACTSMRPITATDAQTWQSQLQVGDEVDVRKSDGSAALLTIEQIDDTGFSGGGQTIAYADISELSVRKTSVGKSSALGFGILIGVMIIGLSTIDEGDIFAGD